MKKRNEERQRNGRDRPRAHARDVAPLRQPVEAARSISGVYGVLPVLEALRSGSRRIERVLIAEGVRQHRLSEIFDLARTAGVIIEKVPRERLEKATGLGVNHQGVFAQTSAADYHDADDVLASAVKPELFVLLDGIEDPRNLGAIIRTAECAGAGGLFLPERRAVGLTETVAKSSAGAIEHLKVAKVANLNRFIGEIKERNIWVVGTSGDAQMPYSEWDWTAPTALVLGAEGTGLHRLVAENCDALVKIPMYGKIDSLNVSVAAGVVLFEARRQRELKGS